MKELGFQEVLGEKLQGLAALGRKGGACWEVHDGAQDTICWTPLLCVCQCKHGGGGGGGGGQKKHTRLQQAKEADYAQKTVAGTQHQGPRITHCNSCLACK